MNSTAVQIHKTQVVKILKEHGVTNKKDIKICFKKVRSYIETGSGFNFSYEYWMSDEIINWIAARNIK